MISTVSGKTKGRRKQKSNPFIILKHKFIRRSCLPCCQESVQFFCPGQDSLSPGIFVRLGWTWTQGNSMSTALSSLTAKFLCKVLSSLLGKDRVRKVGGEQLAYSTDTTSCSICCHPGLTSHHLWTSQMSKPAPFQVSFISVSCLAWDRGRFYCAFLWNNCTKHIFSFKKILVESHEVYLKVTSDSIIFLL